MKFDFSSITEILREGMLRGIVSHNKADIPKQANLRGGNAGAVIDGKLYGNCPRTTALRLAGVQAPSDEQAQLLMAFGVANEDVVHRFLQSYGIPPEQLKREEEIPVVWEHPSGRLVTGRPDAVILDENGQPFWGLELKLKGTVYGAKNILFDGKADTKHIIQAAHYMYKLGLKRYSIIYSIPVRFAVGEKDKDKAKKLGLAELNKYKGDAQYYKLGFFEAVMERDDAGVITLTSLQTGKRPAKSVVLPLTESSISDYYGMVVALFEKKKMPPRPSAASVIKGQKEWSECDYCILKDTCDSFEEAPIDVWFDNCVSTITQAWNEMYPELFDAYLQDWEVE